MSEAGPSVTSTASCSALPDWLAATVSALLAVPGAPMMSVMSPSLPAAITDSTLSAVRLSTATFSGSSEAPKLPPSDMETMLMRLDSSPLASASVLCLAMPSSASSTRSVVPPLSPNTLYE